MSARRGGRQSAPPERAAWEQLPGETNKGYQAFLLYRDVGPTRSLGQVARLRQCGLSTVKALSGRHDWLARASAWDAAQAAEAARAQQPQRLAALAQQAADAELLRKLCRAFLQGLVRRNAETGQLELDKSLKPRDAATLYRLAQDIDKSLPPPPEPVEDEDDPLATMSNAELRQLLARLEAAEEGGNRDGDKRQRGRKGKRPAKSRRAGAR